MWAETNNQLYRKFTFRGFSEAMNFMQLCADIMDEMNHHATWTNTYNRVEIWLCTHDAGNIVTEKDRELASRIDSVFATF